LDIFSDLKQKNQSMKQRLLLVFLCSAIAAYSQVVNNLVMFCNEGEPFTLILNGQRVNMEPQTRVKAEGLTVKKYETKVIFKNPSIKDANTTITFFRTGKECEFVLKKKSKKKYKIEYFTEKNIEGFNNGSQTGNNSSNQELNTPVNNTSPVPTQTVTETVSAPINTVEPVSPTGINPNSGKCDTPMSESQFASFKSSIQNLSTDAEKQARSLAMLQAACITVNQLKQLLDVFLSDNAKYEFAKQAYEKTKDNSEFAKLSEVFLDVLIKEKFQKFVQSKK
jgi:hypothetical protein